MSDHIVFKRVRSGAFHIVNFFAHSRWIIVCLLVLMLLVIASFVKEQIANKPYIEADGYVDTVRAPAIGWVTSNKIIYTVNANDAKDSFSDISHKLLDNYATTKQVNFFNLITKNTEPYKNGQLLEYDNGEATIRLYDISTNSPSDNSLNMRVILSGPLGSETQKEYKSPNIPSKLGGFDKCANDNSANGEPSIHLKPEHGCVRVPDRYSKDRRWIFFRTDGDVIELMKTSNYSYGSAHWIDWLGAYMLGDETNYLSDKVNTTDKLKILTPIGKLSFFDVGAMVQHARPTRAGIVAAENSGGWTSGLRVWHQGQVIKITSGTVIASEVSPDGCKIAYVTNQKLRVINVCELFGVASDANPF